MGIYTDLTLKVKLKSNTPEAVIDAIKDTSEKSKEERFKLTEHGNPDTGSDFLSIIKQDDNQWLVSCNVSIKNFNDEIDKFLMLITPHVASQGNCGTFKEEALGQQEVSFDGQFSFGKPFQDYF
jgi:hypothetical protein